MTKKELIAKVAEQTALPNKQVNEIVTATFAAIHGELVNGGQVQLIGFGTFKVTERAKRKGRNIQTGKTINIPAHNLPVFVAGKTLKYDVR